MESRKNLQYYYPDPDTQFEFDESDDHWNSVGSRTRSSIPVPPPTSHPEIKKPSTPKKISSNNYKIGGTSRNSFPVKVAAKSSTLIKYYEDDDIDQDQDGIMHVDVLPPHQYLAKIRAASMSVQEGVGRTLKGRDQTRVRNDVFNKTGFQD